MTDNELSLPAETEPVLSADTPVATPITPEPAPAPKVIRRVVRRDVGSTVPTEFLWLLLPIIFALGLGTGWLLWGGRSTTVAAVDQGSATRYSVDEAGNPAVGPENAPVTMIEFSDYQCPYCKRWYDSVKTRLLNDYKDKVRFVYRDYPLRAIHPQAQSAAEAANCAGAQNAYWKYHDALFSSQYGLSDDAYIKYASDLGLDTNEFQTCYQEHRYQEEVNADAAVGATLGITGTPTFFVNGLKIVGAQPYEVFQQIIDNELKTAKNKNQ